MKAKILKIAKDLEYGIITEEKARLNFLMLFDIKSSFVPLTINRVEKILNDLSKEAFIKGGGSEHEYKIWWKNRNKQFLNKKYEN